MKFKNSIFVILPFLLVVIIILTSCSKDLDYVLTDGFCIEFADGAILNHNEIDYYDISSNYVYLKSTNSLLKKHKHGSTFKVYADKEMIYTGTFYSLFSSSIPQGPFIYESVFPEYPDFFVSIDFLPSIYNSGQQLEDYRSDARIISALSKYEQLRNGIGCVIKTLNISNDNSVTLQIEVSNLDNENYYIFDPDKMGMGLFHFFTNGLILADSENRHFKHSVMTVVPNPVDEWKMEWLTLLEAGTSKEFTLVYEDFAPLLSGEYKAFFSYPSSLVGVEKTEIQQENGRLWLGELRVTKNISID